MPLIFLKLLIRHEFQIMDLNSKIDLTKPMRSLKNDKTFYNFIFGFLESQVLLIAFGVNRIYIRALKFR